MAFIKNGDPQPIMEIYKSAEECDEETRLKFENLKNLSPNHKIDAEEDQGTN